MLRTQRNANRSGPVLAACALVAASVAGPALAASPQTVSRAGGRFGPGAKAEKHPKVVMLTQVIGEDFAGGNGDYRFCATYERSAAGSPDKGSVSATVELVRDDAAQIVARLAKTPVKGRRAQACSTDGVALEADDLLVWTLKFKAMGKVPAGETVDFAGEVLAPGDAFGSFRLAGAGYDETVLYAEGAHLVFCRTDAGFADLWIRLAEQRAADGENGPHVDIDVCNHAGGGTFGPLDPSNPGCAGGKTFDVFWHDGPDAFVNTATASQCELRLTDHGDRLDGAFRCAGLGEIGGNRSLDLVDGLFRCVVDE